VTVQWDLDLAPAGTYRLVHNGVAKKWGVLGPTYVSFSGASRSFKVQ
jgi:hypothetical protein